MMGINENQPMSRGAAEGVKAVLRRPLASAGNALLRLSGRRAGLVLAYHRIGDPHQRWDEGGLNPRLGKSFFEAQLRHLSARYRVVPASELLSAVQSRRRGERFPVAITFDDDLPSHARDAMPILKRVGVPATFFVSGASLNGPFSFWWERVERAMDRGALSEAELREMVPAQSGARDRRGELRRIAEDIELMAPDERESLSEELGKRAGPDPPDAGLREADLRALVDSGFEIGFHTLRHPNLASLDGPQLELAMTEGRERIAAAIGRELSSIAYPGGKWDQRTPEAARAAGYRLGFTTDPEPVLPDSDPLCIGRVDPLWCETLGHFALTLSRVLRRTNGYRRTPGSTGLRSR
jgi:peptidoglycan/xylan/chitin deacetylase (PgdA/CDA1 family)